MKFVWTVRPFHKDERGEMTHLLPGDIKIIGVVLITCKKGSVRANHYHKHDAHYSYIIKGSMKYVHQELGEKRSPKRSFTVKAGQIVVTPPMFAHAMKFLEESTFLALTTEPRDRENYETDTVRVKLI